MYNYFQQQPDFLGAMKNYTGGGVNTWTAPTTPIPSAMPQLLQRSQQVDPVQQVIQKYSPDSPGVGKYFIDSILQQFGISR